MTDGRGYPPTATSPASGDNAASTPAPVSPPPGQFHAPASPAQVSATAPVAAASKERSPAPQKPQRQQSDAAEQQQQPALQLEVKEPSNKRLAISTAAQASSPFTAAELQEQEERAERAAALERERARKAEEEAALEKRRVAQAEKEAASKKAKPEDATPLHQPHEEKEIVPHVQVQEADGASEEEPIEDAVEDPYALVPLEAARLEEAEDEDPYAALKLAMAEDDDEEAAAEGGGGRAEDGKTRARVPTARRSANSKGAKGLVAAKRRRCGWPPRGPRRLVLNEREVPRWTRRKLKSAEAKANTARKRLVPPRKRSTTTLATPVSIAVSSSSAAAPLPDQEPEELLALPVEPPNDTVAELEDVAADADTASVEETLALLDALPPAAPANAVAADTDSASVDDTLALLDALQAASPEALAAAAADISAAIAESMQAPAAPAPAARAQEVVVLDDDVPAAPGTVSYSDGLQVAFQKLQEHDADPETVVKNLWARLSDPDRQRFGRDFPQFLHYVVPPAAPQLQPALHPAPQPAPQQQVFTPMAVPGQAMPQLQPFLVMPSAGASHATLQQMVLQPMLQPMASMQLPGPAFPLGAPPVGPQHGATAAPTVVVPAPPPRAPWETTGGVGMQTIVRPRAPGAQLPAPSWYQ